MNAPNLNLPPGVSANDTGADVPERYHSWPVFQAEHPVGVDAVLGECATLADRLFDELEAIRKGGDDLIFLVTAKMAVTRWRSCRDEAARKWLEQQVD